MESTSTNETIHGLDALPQANPEAVKEAYDDIIGRHVLATLRADSGMTLEQVAAKKGVTKAAAHQLETKPFGKVGVSSLVAHLQALGYPVDENWIAKTVTEALPARS